MKTLVVTGGIGSGKSTVCRHFASKGIPVYDSDSRARRLYDEDRQMVRRLDTALGGGILNEKGGIDTGKLSSVIFSNPGKLHVVESIVHPAVKEDFVCWRDSFLPDAVPFVVMESAIILEKPLFNGIADKVLLVDAPLRTRLERACSRDGVSRESILKRMEGQKLLNDISEGKADSGADFVIVNDSDVGTLLAEADAVYEAMCKAI